MTGDDDLRETLPDPPPPAPSRREAAIEEAMRRFDGAGPSPSPKPAHPGRAGWMRRPQFGALVTVALMAVIGVPAAWLAVERHDGAEQRSLAPRASDFAATSNPALPQLEAPGAAPTKQAPAKAERPTAPTAVADANPPVGTESTSEDKATGQKQDRPNDRYASYRVAPVVQPPALVAAPVVSAPAAPASAPPPPAAMAEIAPSASLVARARSADSIVVTGSRISTRRVERGDWNACTVDDPRRDLSLCSQSLGTSAPSPDGTAASRNADGVLRAWREDLGGAIQSFDAATTIAPESGDAYLNRSLAYARLGDEERAFSDANKAVRHAGDKARALYNRSVLLRRRGEIAKAQKDEDRAMTLDPSYAAVIPR